MKAKFILVTYVTKFLNTDCREGSLYTFDAVDIMRDNADLAFNL